MKRKDKKKLDCVVIDCENNENVLYPKKGKIYLNYIKGAKGKPVVFDLTGKTNKENT